MIKRSLRSGGECLSGHGVLAECQQALHFIFTSALQGENPDSSCLKGKEAHPGEATSCLPVFRTTGLREHMTYHANKINKVGAQKPFQREVIPTRPTSLLWSWSFHMTKTCPGWLRGV